MERGRMSVVRRRSAKRGMEYAQGRPVKEWREVRAECEVVTSSVTTSVMNCGRGEAWKARERRRGGSWRRREVGRVVVRREMDETCWSCRGRNLVQRASAVMVLASSY
jgi:hypothetical protein